MNQTQHPDLQVCILAAGKGTRMRSRLPKVLHRVVGRAMIDHVLHAVGTLQPGGMALVVGHEAGAVRRHVGTADRLHWVEQKEQLGTGHAVLQCEPVISEGRDVLIVCGDTPLLGSETLAHLVAEHRRMAADVTVLTALPENPFGYGRIVRDEAGRMSRIVEEKDASDTQRQIAEVSSGIYCVRREILFGLLHSIENNNAQGEYYLPDVVPLALGRGLSVEAVAMADANEMCGINDRAQLAAVEAEMQAGIIRHWQMHGVTIEQPGTVRIEVGVVIGADCLIHAGCQLLGQTLIGHGCELGPYAVLQDSRLGNYVQVAAFSHLERASVAEEARVGPYARLRPGTEIGEGAGIGNFVEVKAATIGRGSKVNHLSYIGDASIGEGCNVGAGTITCNYDGANKHRTEIGDDVFIGSDTQLVAPVRVGDGATIGAGSTITKDVAAGGLTLSKRSGQQHLESWQRPRKEKS